MLETRRPTLLRRWLTQPQTVWLRKALFQVHLWTGLAVGVYLIVASVTGIVLVFRVEMGRAFDTSPDLAWGFRFISWLIDLHDNLLGGSTGRLVNGIGGLLLLLLAVTGAVIWWPGTRSWRRSLTLQRKANWKRFIWNLHGFMGFWAIAFIFMWAITGAYLVFQQQLAPLVDAAYPYNENFDPRPIDDVLNWFTRVHYGRFGGMWTKLAWTVFGLVPPALFVTGGLMWWNRVARRGARTPLSGEGV